MASARWAFAVGVVAITAVGVSQARTAPQVPADVQTRIVQPGQMTDQEFQGSAYLETDSRIRVPLPTHQIQPKYTANALRAKVQGIATLQAVVMPDGTVGRVRVVKSVDPTFGLDDQALLAAAQWTFQPGTLNGQAVPVLVTFTLEFRLH